MSCGGPPRSVNPERPGESGEWVRQYRPASRSATCVHRWQYRNGLGIVGGPTVQECLCCGESHWPAWVAHAARPALPAADPATQHERRMWPFLVGEAEWADLLREKGAA